MNSENYLHICENIYIVKTQSGFKQAAKCFAKYTNGEIIQEFPNQYPCVVFFTEEYTGGGEDLFFSCLTTENFLTNVEKAKNYLLK